MKVKLHSNVSKKNTIKEKISKYRFNRELKRNKCDCYDNDDNYGDVDYHYYYYYHHHKHFCFRCVQTTCYTDY